MTMINVLCLNAKWRIGADLWCDSTPFFFPCLFLRQLSQQHAVRLCLLYRRYTDHIFYNRQTKRGSITSTSLYNIHLSTRRNACDFFVCIVPHRYCVPVWPRWHASHPRGAKLIPDHTPNTLQSLLALRFYGKIKPKGAPSWRRQQAHHPITISLLRTPTLY